jgi:hypothetical protein
VNDQRSPWLTGAAASEYLSGGVLTGAGRRKFAPRYLAKQVKAGRLRAARIGGRGELLYRREWLDAYVEDQSAPVQVIARRRA